MLKEFPSNERLDLPSASYAPRIYLCAGSWLAERAAGDISSYDAESGNRVAAAIADVRLNGIKIYDAALKYGLLFEEKETLLKAIKVTNIILERVFPDLPFGYLRAQMVEHRLIFCNALGIAIGSAKVDVAYKHPDKNIWCVIDDKSLYGDVADAPINVQLRWQSLGVYQHCNADRIYCAINQPNVTFSPSITVYENHELNGWVLSQTEERIAIAQGLDPIYGKNPPRTAGHLQCKLCSARFDCKAAEAYYKNQIAVKPSFDTLTQAQVDELIPKFKFLEKFAKDGMEQIKRRLKENPAYSSKYLIGKGSEVKEVSDFRAALAIAEKLKEDGVDVDAALGLSIAKLSKAYATAKQISADKARKAVEALLANYIQTSTKEGSIEEK